MGLILNYNDHQTPLDGDEISGLLIHSVMTQQDLNEHEQLNIEKAELWLVRLKLDTDTILSETFLKKLHRKMYGDVWKWAGQFRLSNRNIGVEWSQIGIQLKYLLDDTKFWIANQTFPNHEISIRFKHRLVAIHCFPNGNGRHSRLMADIIMTSIFKEPRFGWQKSNMVKPDSIRKQYINALKLADQGQYNTLIEFAKD